MTRETGQRSRLRFADLEYERFQDGRCRVTVLLEWKAGRLFTGEATGTEALEGNLRTAAQATLEGAEKAADGELTLSLTGIKTVRAFDGVVIIAGVKATGAEISYRLLGAEVGDQGDLVRAAVRTVLDAVNRVLEKYVPVD